ncbi:putative fatty acyl-CoA reductase [Nymphaea thermarum]|nr:putative fatty acyl-CoA reductase [Nymphaea thermarum]
MLETLKLFKPPAKIYLQIFFLPHHHITFSIGHLSFVSPSTLNAARLAANQVPANYSLSFISPPHHLRSSTPQPASCTFNSFAAKITRPAPLVSMVDRKWASQSKGALVVTSAGLLTMPKEWEVAEEEEEEDGCGLGIVEFLRDKNMLITGTTGFVGKLLIEKILRSQPDVGKLFLLIQGPNQEAVNERLKHEIINAEIFKRLKEVHGSSFEAFMLSKLVPVVGHLEEDALGMEEKVQKDIADNVDVIVSCAANTKFDERYDVALNTNTNGASRLVKLARRCRKLKVFLHVSTGSI